MSINKYIIFIVETGIGKLRTSLFQNHIKKLGGIIQDSIDLNLTHIIVDGKIDCVKLCTILKLIDCKSLQGFIILSSKWLSASIDRGQFIKDIDVYLINCEHYKNKNMDSSSITLNNTITSESEFNNTNVDHKVQVIKKTKYSGSHKNDNDYDSSSYESDAKEFNEYDDTAKFSHHHNSIPLKRKWICQLSSKSMKFNNNKHITDKLEELMNAYQNINDKWRVLGYRKAIVALKKYPTEITSYEEAKSISGVGERLAEKIAEIIESGELRKLNEIMSQDQTQALKLFTNVWGAGPNAARNWVMQGYRTLEDLKNKAHLTKHQTIGVQLYHDLIDRMPRSEVEKIAEIIKENVLLLQAGLTVEVCGSYRRGKMDCGDVDILISHSDGKSHHGIFHKLIDRLHSIDFLTHDLVISDKGRQQKYLGVCKLTEEGSKHRRLDIIVVPYCEYATALLYFTGSGLFNRSMRNLASQMKMSLNEHGLYSNVSRIEGEKIDKGRLVSISTEESIFKILNVPHRPPNERDF